MEKLKINRWSDWIDFTSGGIFAGIFGGDWVPKALTEGHMSVCYSAHYTNDFTERYIDMLKEFTGFESVALFSTGAEATEAFWRACRAYSGLRGVWGGLPDPDDVGKEAVVSDSMHGVTLGAMIMAGKMSPPFGTFGELGAAYHSLPPEATGGMIMEPYHAPSAQFHREDPTIARIKNHRKDFPDIPLCIDEIQSGFGRTGKLFGYEWYSGLKPDFITIGKAAGGGFPISALLGPKEIMEDKRVIEGAHLHSTHSGHPLMCAIGIEVIERIMNEGLIYESHAKGMLLYEHLKDCGVRFHAGRGLLAGLEFKDTDQANEVVTRCREKGLLTVPTDRKWVKLGPPLKITEGDLGMGCMLLKDAIEEVTNEDGNT